MGRSMGKRELTSELAAAAGLKRKQVEAVLDELVAVACREAHNGFRIPGLCRLSVVQRKARRARNPATGETLLIGAHEALRITALKKARDTVAPRPDGLVQVVEEAPAPAAAPAPRAETFVSFLCPACKQEIEAPADMAGTDAPCPACSTPLTVPSRSDTIFTPTAAQGAEQEDLRSKTIRIELPDSL